MKNEMLFLHLSSSTHKPNVTHMIDSTVQTINSDPETSCISICITPLNAVREVYFLSP